MRMKEERLSDHQEKWIRIKAVNKNWETWQKRMMDRLRPDHLLPFEFSLEPNEIIYETNGKMPLSAQENLLITELEHIFEQIEALESLSHDYWMDLGNYCRDPESVFLDSSGNLFWVYEPSVDPEDPGLWKKGIYLALMNLGVENHWEDDRILKCYHRYCGGNYALERKLESKEEDTALNSPSTHPKQDFFSQRKKKKERKVGHFRWKH